MDMTTKNYIRIVAVILTIIGALNWGLVGIANVDLVAQLFGEFPTFSRIVYVLIGLSGAYLLFILKKLL
jgi:uncharacterized membrane protein YuzA (DUF378 family)